MANYTWPPTLPQLPLRDNYGEQGGVNVLRTTMDAGPAKLRRRSKLTKPLEVSFRMTSAQVATLESFVESTLFGVRRFNWTHPRTLAAVEVRIVPAEGGKMFSLVNLGGTMWEVSMSLEVMP